MGSVEWLKINNEKLFDQDKNTVSDVEKKAISENLQEFQKQFKDFKAEIVHNLDKANKDILVKLYNENAEVKKQIDGIIQTINEDPSYQSKYITMTSWPLEKRLMGVMQMGAAICVNTMQTKVEGYNTIQKVLQDSYYKGIKNSWFDGMQGPNTTSVFIDILSRSGEKFDGTITTSLIEHIYTACHDLEKNPVNPKPGNDKEKYKKPEEKVKDLEQKKADLDKKISDNADAIRKLDEEEKNPKTTEKRKQEIKKEKEKLQKEGKKITEEQNKTINEINAEKEREAKEKADKIIQKIKGYKINLGKGSGDLSYEIGNIAQDGENYKATFTDKLHQGTFIVLFDADGKVKLAQWETAQKVGTLDSKATYYVNSYLGNDNVLEVLTENQQKARIEEEKNIKETLEKLQMKVHLDDKEVNITPTIQKINKVNEKGEVSPENKYQVSFTVPGLKNLDGTEYSKVIKRNIEVITDRNTKNFKFDNVPMTEDEYSHDGRQKDNTLNYVYDLFVPTKGVNGAATNIIDINIIKNNEKTREKLRAKINTAKVGPSETFQKTVKETIWNVLKEQIKNDTLVGSLEALTKKSIKEITCDEFLSLEGKGNDVDKKVINKLIAEFKNHPLQDLIKIKFADEQIKVLEKGEENKKKESKLLFNGIKDDEFKDKTYGKDLNLQIANVYQIVGKVQFDVNGNLDKEQEQLSIKFLNKEIKLDMISKENVVSYDVPRDDKQQPKTQEIKEGCETLVKDRKKLLKIINNTAIGIQADEVVGNIKQKNDVNIYEWDKQIQSIDPQNLIYDMTRDMYAFTLNNKWDKLYFKKQKTDEKTKTDEAKFTLVDVYGLPVKYIDKDKKSTNSMIIERGDNSKNKIRRAITMIGDNLKVEKVDNKWEVITNIPRITFDTKGNKTLQAPNKLANYKDLPQRYEDGKNGNAIGLELYQADGTLYSKLPIQHDETATDDKKQRKLVEGGKKWPVNYVNFIQSYFKNQFESKQAQKVLDGIDLYDVFKKTFNNSTGKEKFKDLTELDNRDAIPVNVGTASQPKYEYYKMIQEKDGSFTMEYDKDLQDRTDFVLRVMENQIKQLILLIDTEKTYQTNQKKNRQKENLKTNTATFDISLDQRKKLFQLDGNNDNDTIDIDMTMRQFNPENNEVKDYTLTFGVETNGIINMKKNPRTERIKNEVTLKQVTWGEKKNTIKVDATTYTISFEDGNRRKNGGKHNIIFTEKIDDKIDQWQSIENKEEKKDLKIENTKQ